MIASLISWYKLTAEGGQGEMTVWATVIGFIVCIIGSTLNTTLSPHLWWHCWGCTEKSTRSVITVLSENKNLVFI